MTTKILRSEIHPTFHHPFHRPFQQPYHQAYHKPSHQPLLTIKKAGYAGQPQHLRKYKSGYELYFGSLPKFGRDAVDLKFSELVIAKLSEELSQAPWVLQPIADEKFERTFIGIEDSAPHASLLVAKWGTGFTSPVHGHAPGWINETLLYGKIRVSTFFQNPGNPDQVRLLETVIIDKPGTFVSEFLPLAHYTHPRPGLIHTFTAIEPSATLHYVPEYTRDSRDNTFVPESFDLDLEMTTRITAKEGLYSKVGTVILVRSMNVPEYGDHFILVTGPAVKKEHGLRPQDRSYAAGDRSTKALDSFELEQGLVLLKLNPDATREFFKFHGIIFEDGQLTFPHATPIKL